MSEGKTILIVDDDPDVLETLDMMIQADGHTPVRAHTMAEGLEVFQREKPDLVIADLMMETVDAGAQLVDAVRSADASIPVYLLSSVGKELNENTLPQDIRADGILQKPIKAELLKQILGERLN